MTGQKIIREIVAGQHDPQALAAYCDVRIKASEEEIAKSLQGDWRAEHLFALKQALAGFDFCVAQLAECDTETERVLRELHAHEGTPAKGKKRSRSRNAPKFDVREHLFKVCDVDLTRIDGIDVSTALVVISEIAPNLSRFPTVRHFASRLGLCPGTRVSGGRDLGTRSKRTANRVTQALKLVAAALHSSKSALGCVLPAHVCSHGQAQGGVTAAAHKLARLIYMMLTKGEQYADQGQQYFEQRYRERVVRQLTKRETFDMKGGAGARSL